MKKKVLVAAGGTGGHIFPALAFGRWVSDQGKAESIVYVSGSRLLEEEIYAAHGVKPYRLAMEGSPLGVSLWRGLRRCVGLFRSFIETRSLLRREQPDICFLFGSYVSAAPLFWCKWLGVPVVIHEQNACAGKVTRAASRLGVPVASGWSECRGVGNAIHVGVPVRSFRRLSRKEAASILEVEAEDGVSVIGVIGGSLGSAPLSALIEKVSRETAGRRCMFIVLGDRINTYTEGEVKFVGRHWDMAPFYSLCDAVVCRAGASTLAELAAYGIPALVVPWGGAADGHQEANAREFSALTGNLTWVEEEGNLDGTFEKFLTRVFLAHGRSGDFVNDAASSALWRFGEEKWRQP